MFVKEISEKSKVEEIADLLPETDATLFFYNRCASVDDQDLIGEAFDSNDPVTVWVGAPPEEEVERSERKNLTNIKNNSDFEIIMVAQTKKGMPIFFEKNQLAAVKFDSWAWSNKIALYR